jgi:hypothetical protein
MILAMPGEMVPEVVDPMGQESDLDGCAASVALVELVLLNDLFAFLGHPRRASTGVYAAGEAPLNVFVYSL